MAHLYTTLLFADGLNWRSWEDALIEADKTQKMIMVDAVRDGCHYCDDMQKNVFDDNAMAEFIEKRFIPVKVNLSKRAMPFGINVSMTPSFYFFTADRGLVKMIPGSWNQEDFRDFLEGIKQ